MSAPKLTPDPTAISYGTDFTIRVPTFATGTNLFAVRLACTTLLLLSLLFLVSISSLANTTGDQRKGRAPGRHLTRAEIKQAEGRLEEMGYGPGRVDGVIDSTAKNALIAFQKLEGLKVTGGINRDNFDAIMNANAPQPRESGYRHVEVDLQRQVLLLTDDNGVVQRVLPISSGSNKQYREKGGSGLAYTPRGRFRITAKIAGWRKSPLGLLYYPSYFSGGVAIHGNPSVPNEPESHGCVRIPMSAAIDVSRMLPLGTIVLVYDERSFVSAKDWAMADKQKQEASVRQ